MSKKKVAVIILNWNGAKLLRRYLPSVVSNTDSSIADVIVADNGSTDNSLQVLAEEFPDVKVIKLDTNHGFAEGYNLAIAQTAYPYTVLLNSDVRVPDGWLPPLYEYCESHPEVGALQPKILHDEEPDDAPVFEYAGAAGGYIDCHGYPYCRGRLFDVVEPDHGQYDSPLDIDIFWASGAALFVRSEVYLQAGGLDKQFFAHMEEIDLCWRIHQLGYAVKMVSNSRVFHLGGGSLPASNPRKTYLNFRNNLLLLHKNLPQSASKTRLLFVRRLYDTLALMMFVLKFEWGNVKAVWNAHRDFRTMRKSYTKFPDVNLMPSLPGTQHNIIIDHYLRGVKKY